jgi:uncharacterized protein (TIGR02145 family)
MKKFYFLFVSLFIAASYCYGVSYTITFTGSGASTTVGDVTVENLMTGAKVVVPAGDDLLLTDVITGIGNLKTDDEMLSVYPNPAINGKTTVTFFAKNAGAARLSLFSLNGSKIVGIDQNLLSGVNSFRLSLPEGSFIIQVKGNGYSHTAKVINHSAMVSKAGIDFIGVEKQSTAVSLKSTGSTNGSVTMLYHDGERLLYTGTSGDFSTVYVDVPSSDATIDFPFYACTDGSGNNYKVVNIGGKIWMAENLKTTKYNDGTDVELGTAESWQFLTTAAYIPNPNYSDRVFYNWYAASDPKIAPEGWHVPTMAEWGEFIITARSIIGDVDTISVGISDAHGWAKVDGANRPGSDTTKNNITGFSVIPTGYFDGTLKNDKVVQDFWSSDEMNAENGNVNNMWNNYWDLYQLFGSIKWSGANIRCVMDVEKK